MRALTVGDGPVRVQNSRFRTHNGLIPSAGARTCSPTGSCNTIYRSEFADSIEKIMKEEGPVFVSMKMIPKIENEPIGRRERRPQRSRAETIKDLQSELGITVA